MSIQEMFELVRDGGSLLLLVVAVIGGFKGWYVWRWVYDREVAATMQMMKERDEWKNVALQGLAVAERVTS